MREEGVWGTRVRRSKEESDWLSEGKERVDVRGKL